MRCAIIHRFQFSALLGLAVSISASVAVGAQQSPRSPASEPARISLARGEVFAQRGESRDWIAATTNLAAYEGDTLVTSPDARSEVSYASASSAKSGSWALHA